MLPIVMKYESTFKITELICLWQTCEVPSSKYDLLLGNLLTSGSRNRMTTIGNEFRHRLS